MDASSSNNQVAKNIIKPSVMAQKAYGTVSLSSISVIITDRGRTNLTLKYSTGSELVSRLRRTLIFSEEELDKRDIQNFQQTA